MSVSAVGDGRLGFPEGAPYDAIHVGAAASAVPKSVRRLFFGRCEFLSTLDFRTLGFFFAICVGTDSPGT